MRQPQHRVSVGNHLAHEIRRQSQVSRARLQDVTRDELQLVVQRQHDLLKLGDFTGPGVSGIAILRGAVLELLAPFKSGTVWSLTCSFPYPLNPRGSSAP